eukprot:1369530-Pleurochrysis_carterae.AAC.5
MKLVATWQAVARRHKLKLGNTGTTDLRAGQARQILHAVAQRNTNRPVVPQARASAINTATQCSQGGDTKNATNDMLTSNSALRATCWPLMSKAQQALPCPRMGTSKTKTDFRMSSLETIRNSAKAEDGGEADGGFREQVPISFGKAYSG